VPVAGPDRVELVQGALWADVVDHTLQLSQSPTRCWTVVTQGLSRNSQREMVISVANRDGSAFPVGVFHYLGTVGRLAAEGRRVDSGGITAFQPPGPFGFGAFLGGVYTPATGDHGVPVPPGALQVVLLRDGELDMANRCSPWRVLARLGQIAQFVPWPFWSDPARPLAYQAGDADRSLLSKVPRLKLGRLDASPDGNSLQVRLSVAEAAQLASQLAAQHFAALVPEPDPASPATLVWSPGQAEPQAICADPARTPFISARFLVIVTGQSAHDQILFQEDGWSVMTAPATGDILLRNLASGQGIEINVGRRVILNVA
jgi:hypothetical protein